MTDPRQPTPTPNSFERPSARAAAAMPMPRSNYGIPSPRTAAPTVPTPSLGPRSMDIMTPRRPSAPTPPAPPSPPTPPPTPVTTTVSTDVVPVVQPTNRQPLYTNAPSPQATATQPAKRDNKLSRLRLVLLTLGALLALGGAVRWATAGSTANNLIAAGAVAANDGNTMTIQFTADDGKMHKFTAKSNVNLVPGSGVQVAYRSGAPENSAKQVEPIKAAHRLGVWLLVSGIAILGAGGLLTLVIRRLPKRPGPASIAKPVTV